MVETFSPTIIVAYRCPFDQNEPVTEPDTNPQLTIGGLVSALSGLLKSDSKCTWVGYAAGSHDVEAIAAGDGSGELKILFDHGEYNFDIRKVFLGDELADAHYLKFCNSFLWPLCHITNDEILKSLTFPKPQIGKTEEERKKIIKAYNLVNNSFASVVNAELWSDSTQPVLVQDYHFYPFAKLIKKQNPNSKIVHFMHIPFFDIDAKDAREIVDSEKEIIKELISGVLNSDVVGFHIQNYVDNFLKAVKYLFLDEIKSGKIKVDEESVIIDNHKCRVLALPIGVDIQKIKSGAAIENKNNLVGYESYSSEIAKAKENNVKVITMLGRLDYTKGWLEGLDIIEELLKHGLKLKFFCVGKSSREEITAYGNLIDMVEERVKEINKKYSESLGYAPISFTQDGLAYPNNIRLMRDSDINLIPSLEDGMNLVVLEAILSQEKTKLGPIIVGNCGASIFLKDFSEEDGLIRINPHNANEAAKRIIKFLDKKINDEIVQKIVKDANVTKWSMKLLENLYAKTITIFKN